MSDASKTPCSHDFTEREVAVADGYCPLCLAAELTALREELEATRARLAEAEKDEERYRWLRNHGWDNVRPIPLGDGLDAAIDAARSREGKE